MPLSPELVKLIGMLPEAEREGYTKRLTEMEEGALRQSDYSRKMNELKSQREAWEGEHNKHLDWYKKANAEYQTVTSELSKKDAELAELNAQIESLRRTRQEAGFAGDDEGEAAAMKELKVAQKAAEAAQKRIDALESSIKSIDEQLKSGKLMTQDQVRQEMTQAGDALGGAILKIIKTRDRFRSEFGKDLDEQALISEAQKRGGDLDAAYEFLSQEDRKEKLRKDIELEVEKRYQEKLRANNLPIAETGEVVLGPIQQRLLKKQGEGSTIPDDIQADGSGRLAALLAQELRAEGKS